MKKFRVYPYAMSSMSGRDLAKKLREAGYDCLRVFPDGNYHPFPGHIIINWGMSTIPNWLHLVENGAKLLNYPKAVSLSINKLKSFVKLSQNGVSVPLFTTDINDAKVWATDTKSPIVVCRTTVSGHAGRGIVIATNPDEIVEAPLYTKHVRHKREFRVHVLHENIIDFTEKKKPNEDTPVASEYVRNHEGGWKFCRIGVILPEECKIQAINAVKVLGLDFGAVDVAYRVKENRAFILEINTAPGFDIESATLKSYVEAFINL